MGGCDKPDGFVNTVTVQCAGTWGAFGSWIPSVAKDMRVCVSHHLATQQREQQECGFECYFHMFISKQCIAVRFLQTCDIYHCFYKRAKVANQSNLFPFFSFSFSSCPPPLPDLLSLQTLTVDGRWTIDCPLASFDVMVRSP